MRQCQSYLWSRPRLCGISLEPWRVESDLAHLALGHWASNWAPDQALRNPTHRPISGSGERKSPDRPHSYRPFRAIGPDSRLWNPSHGHRLNKHSNDTRQTRSLNLAGTGNLRLHLWVRSPKRKLESGLRGSAKPGWMNMVYSVQRIRQAFLRLGNSEHLLWSRRCAGSRRSRSTPIALRFSRRPGPSNRQAGPRNECLPRTRNRRTGARKIEEAPNENFEKEGPRRHQTTIPTGQTILDTAPKGRPDYHTGQKCPWCGGPLGSCPCRWRPSDSKNLEVVWMACGWGHTRGNPAAPVSLYFIYLTSMYSGGRGGTWTPDPLLVREVL